MLIWTKSMFLPLLMLVFMFLLVFLTNSSHYWLMNDVIILEWPLKCFLVIDKLSLNFCLTVSLVSFSVFLYSFFYMKEILLKNMFIITLLSFVISMFFLIFSSDLFWLMIGWDGLGLSSMLLIFFFQNFKSFNSGMVTFLSNRMGDFFLISSICMMSVLPLWVNQTSTVNFISFFILLGAMSKSAQVPFSSWLPLAMAAPTPVSALVHSSTLVTAGVYLLLRFNKILDTSIMFWLCFLSGITLSVGGSGSTMEYDLKKIIALSTLSHIGLMMFFISMKSLDSATLHMVLHALFKSLLFMIGGCIIHENMGEQDIRLINVSNLSIPLNISLFISLFSMMGIPFFSGFYSKEFFLSEVSSNVEVYKVIVFFISILLTCSYSSRLMFFLYKKKINKVCCSDNSYWVIFYIMSLCSIGGGYIMWSVSSESLEEILFFSLKKILFPIMSLGILFGMVVSYAINPKWPMFVFLNQMWGMSKGIYIFQKMLPQSREVLFVLDSKGIMDWNPHTIIKNMSFISKKIVLLIYSMSFFMSGSFIIFMVMISYM